MDAVRDAYRAGPVAPNKDFRPRSFNSLQHVFRFIAKEEGLDTDPETLLKLAADSRSDRHYFRTDPSFHAYIVESTFFDPEDHMVVNRALNGKGSYYVVRQDQDGYSLVGWLQGNSYEIHEEEDAVKIVTSEHVSAWQSTRYVCVWDGTALRHTNTYKTESGEKLESRSDVMRLELETNRPYCARHREN